MEHTSRGQRAERAWRLDAAREGRARLTVVGAARDAVTRKQDEVRATTAQLRRQCEELRQLRQRTSW